MTDRAKKSEIDADTAISQAQTSREAMTSISNKSEMAQNTIANLTGKLDAMQTQIQEQVRELEVTRQEAKKASQEAAELRGKHTVNIDAKFTKKSLAKTE